MISSAIAIPPHNILVATNIFDKWCSMCDCLCCEDDDLCDMKQCINGFCLSQPDRFTCYCPDGWRGSNCTDGKQYYVDDVIVVINSHDLVTVN